MGARDYAARPDTGPPAESGDAASSGYCLSSSQFAVVGYAARGHCVAGPHTLVQIVMTGRNAHFARLVNQAGPKSLAGVFLREPGGNFGAVELPAGGPSKLVELHFDRPPPPSHAILSRSTTMAVVLSPAAPAFKGIYDDPLRLEVYAALRLGS